MLTLRIEDVADTGQGLSKVDGLVYFVSSGLPGDLVLARVVERKKNYCVCETLELLEPSELRREEFRTLLTSPYGLDLLPLKDEAELALKEKKVRMELQKALGPALAEANFNPIIGLEERYRYRNKAVFPFRHVNSRNVFGAFERLSHNIVEEVDNPSMPLSFSKINDALLDWLNEASLPCYDELSHKGTLRYATIRVNDRGEHLILLTVKEDVLPPLEGLVLRFEAEGIGIKGILKTVKEERGNTPYGRSISLLYGSDRLEDRVGGVRFSLSVNSFFQVSREGCERLYNEVYRLADLDSVRSFWDVYCGVGSIGLYLLAKHRSSSGSKPAPAPALGSNPSEPQPLPVSGTSIFDPYSPETDSHHAASPAPSAPMPDAQSPIDSSLATSRIDAACPSSFTSSDSGPSSAASQIAPSPYVHPLIELWGLEAVEEAVKDASLNASLNGISNAEFEYGLAEKSLERRFKTHKAPDLLIVDPPRKGLERSAVDAIIKAAPERLIYVSCKVSTLARDLKLFTEAGYKLVEVTPVNLFPMTMHVETVVLLARNSVCKTS